MPSSYKPRRRLKDSSSEDDMDDDDDGDHSNNNDKKRTLPQSLVNLLDSDDTASADELNLTHALKPLAAVATAATATHRPSSSFGLKLTRKAPRRSPTSSTGSAARSGSKAVSRTSLARKRQRPSSTLAAATAASAATKNRSNGYKNKENESSDSDSSESLGMGLGIPVTMAKKHPKHILSNDDRNVKKQDDVFSLSSVDTVELTHRIQSRYHSNTRKSQPKTAAAAALKTKTPSWQDSPSSSSSSPLTRQSLPGSIRIATTSTHGHQPSPLFQENDDAGDANNDEDYDDDHPLDDNSTGDASSVDTAELMRRIQGQHNQHQDPGVHMDNQARQLPLHNKDSNSNNHHAGDVADNDNNDTRNYKDTDEWNEPIQDDYVLPNQARQLPLHNTDSNDSNRHDVDVSNDDNYNDNAEADEPIQDDFVLPDQESSSSEDDDDDDEIIIEQRVTPQSSLQRSQKAEALISVPPLPRTLTATAQHSTSRVAPVHAAGRERFVSDSKQDAPSNAHDRHAPGNAHDRHTPSKSHDRHVPTNAHDRQLKIPFLTATAATKTTATNTSPAAQNSRNATALNDEELQNAAFFGTNDVGAARNTLGIVDLCGSDNDDDNNAELYECSSQNVTVREGLRSARKSPHFVTSSRRLSQPAPAQAALPFENLAPRDDDIQYFSDEGENPFDRSRRQSYQTSTASVQRPLHQPQQPPPQRQQSQQQSQQQPHQQSQRHQQQSQHHQQQSQQHQQPQHQPSSAQHHNPYHLSTGRFTTTTSAAAGTGMLPNRWQERPERQRRLRDAASSNTSFAQAVVRRPEAAAAAPAPGATAHRWPPTNSSTAAATSAAGTSDNWFNQWTAAKASGGGGEAHVRNDLVGGSGVGAGSYRMVDSAVAGTGSYDENFEPEHQAQPPARRSARGGKGGYSKKRTKGKSKYKKGGKRGGGGRGRGRGRGRGSATSQNDSGAWSDYGGGGGGGGGGWSTQPSRDDPNLGHVGGAEMSF